MRELVNYSRARELARTSALLFEDMQELDTYNICNIYHMWTTLYPLLLSFEITHGNSRGERNSKKLDLEIILHQAMATISKFQAMATMSICEIHFSVVS